MKTIKNILGIAHLLIAMFILVGFVLMSCSSSERLIDKRFKTRATSKALNAYAKIQYR